MKNLLLFLTLIVLSGTITAQVTTLTYRSHSKPLIYEKPAAMSEELYQMSIQPNAGNYRIEKIYTANDSIVILMDSVFINNIHQEQTHPVRVYTIIDWNTNAVTSVNVNASYASTTLLSDMPKWIPTGEFSKIGSFNAEKYLVKEGEYVASAWITKDLNLTAGPVRDLTFKGVVLYMETPTSISELKSITRSKNSQLPVIAPANEFLTWDEFLDRGKELMFPVIRAKK